VADRAARRPGAFARLHAAVAGVLIHRFGPAIFFPVGGILLIVVVVAALTQNSIRDFGAAPALQAAPAPLADETP